MLPLKNSVIKNIVFTIAVILPCIVCCGRNNPFFNGRNDLVLQSDAGNEDVSYKFVSIREAQKIFGEPAHFKDSIWKKEGSVTKFISTLQSEVRDSVTGQGKRLFFSYEQYPEETAAKETYNSIKAENEKISASAVIHETGDEGFVAKDTLGFPFMMIRKGHKIFKLKLYYAKSTDAFEQLQILAKRLVAEN
jgi:hypothetical protein